MGKESRDTSPWVFAQAHSTRTHSPGSRLSLRLWFQVEPELGVKKCCRLVDISCNYNYNIHKTMIMGSGPIISCQIGGETMETVKDFILGGAPKSLQMVTAAMKLKYACSLEEKL